MTWGQFKAWMVAQGVEDADNIAYIDFSGAPYDVSRYPNIEEMDDAGHLALPDGAAWRFYVE